VGLNVHPVKSCAIRPIETAVVERAGFAGDRRWMVVDEDGKLVSAREEHDLFSIVPDTAETSSAVARGLRLRALGVDDLLISSATGPEFPVRLHRHDLSGSLVSREADEWVSTVVGHPGLRLVRCPDPTARALNPDFSAEGDHTAYADGYPVTLASSATLAQLNDRIAQGAAERGEEAPPCLPMERVRPNVVINGDLAAFVEDTWSTVRIGEVPFRVAKAVDRCVMTTIELADLRTGKEPIRNLARHRRWDGATWFAIHLIPDGTGEVHVGDEVVGDRVRRPRRGPR
jgi:uncharacterized protein YcbX